MNDFTHEQITRICEAKARGWSHHRGDRGWGPDTLKSLENFDWFMAWLEQRFGGRAKRSSRTPCHTKLYQGRKCPAGCVALCGAPRNPHVCRSPKSDHPRLWTVNGKNAALTSEPYALELVQDAEREWANRHGMEMHVFPDKSFHNPGGCALIVFTAKEHGRVPILVP